MNNLEEKSIVFQLSDVRFSVVLDSKVDEISNAVEGKAHIHPFYEVLISLSEVNLMIFDDITEILPSNSLCLIPPGTYHHTKEFPFNKAKRALRFIYEKVHTDNLSEPLYEHVNSLLINCNKPVIFTNIDAENLHSIISKCSKEMALSLPYTKLLVNLLLGQFFIYLLRLLDKKYCVNKKVNQYTEEDSRRLKIETFMHDNLKNKITLKDLSLYMNLSERQTERAIKEIYNKGFRELLIDLRMHLAADLLVRTNKTVEEISCDVGYTSLSGFYSTFKKTWGMSAIKYRKGFSNT